MSKLTIRKKTESKIKEIFIDEKTDKINEYIDENCSLFEKGITEYKFSIDEYEECQYGEGNRFIEQEVWYEDNSIPSNGKDFTKFDDLDKLITHIRHQLNENNKESNSTK